MAGRTDDSNRPKAVLLSDLTHTKAEDLPLPVRKNRENRLDESESEDRLWEPGREESDSPEGKHSGERVRMSAYERAMTILACGDNSERQIREKLEKRGYRYGEIADAVSLLKKKRYLRDDELMERYAASLAKKRQYGAARIRMEMLRRFDRQVVEEFFEDAVSSIDFDAVAAAAAEKCADRERTYRIRKLRGLGFTSVQIRRALNNEKREE